MTSNVFSRLLPTGRDRSFYEKLRARDDTSDVEDRAGLLLDEENLTHEFHDGDLEHAEGLGVSDSRTTFDGRARRIDGAAGGAGGGGGGGRGGIIDPSVRSRRDGPGGWLTGDDDGENNDVPASLLVELADEVSSPLQARVTMKHDRRTTAMPGPSTERSRAQWEATQAQQKLHAEDRLSSAGRGAARGAPPGAFLTGMAASSNARKRAEWRWANVSNLDNFMKDVYDYYQGCGIWCILLERVLHLVNVAFVAVFLTFLTQCIDSSKLRGSTKLSQIMVPQCTQHMSGFWNFGLWVFAFYFVWKSIQYLLDLRRLFNVRDFFVELLNIPEHDMQTITWQDVVARIMALRDQNPKTATSLTPSQRRFLGSQSKERLDASDIANRLMRRENYLIALFNKDILDTSIPLPFLRNRQILSRTLEWTLMFSILDFVFDERGQVNQEFLKSDRRAELSSKLRSRFTFAGIMILVSSPFLAGYLVIVYFLTYYNEYQRNPSALGSRTYTPLAEWKFREFNELPHLFRKRLNMSHPFATHYIDQFPKAKAEMLARTVAFIAGSLATVLAIVSVIDSEMFLSFEITPDRTVLFYLGVLGSVWAFARGSVSEENAVFDPEFALRNVIEYTHYQPDHWQGRLHSFEVKQEFGELYKVKLLIFIEEIISILITPFVLFVSLPRSSDHIVDFFREFTIHVDGLGYVCSFAEFDFKKGVAGAGRKADGAAADVRDDYYSTKHGKMEMSYYGFMGNYGNYALTPKVGGNQAHFPMGLRHHQFHPPPAWPGMHSPTLAADMQASRIGGGGRGGDNNMARSRAPPARATPRFGPAAPPQPSPMASILLDPHHQPPNSTFSARPRHPSRGGYLPPHGDSSTVIEETREDDDNGGGDESNETARAHLDNNDEPFGGVRGGGGLGLGGGGSGAGDTDVMDESTWQTSPAVGLSRENSGRPDSERGDGPDAGVVHMILQFNQAQLNRRPGGRGR